MCLDVEFSTHEMFLLKILICVNAQHGTVERCVCEVVSNCCVYLAAGQVQGSVLVLIQQSQVSLGPVKEDGCKKQRYLDPAQLTASL